MENGERKIRPAETLRRLRLHLAANEIKLERDKAQLVMPLKVQPQGVKIFGNEAVTALLRQKYRAGLEVPEAG